LKIKNILRAILALIFLGGGIYHFVNPEVYLKIMPGFLPYPILLNYASGFLEIIGGIGLITSKYRKPASYLLMFLLFSFLLVHVDHVVKGGIISNDITLPLAAVWFRLGFQGAFIYWAFWVGKE